MAKVVILAGGMGTRLTEETEVRPKPMVEIGGRPIIWHIMHRYAHYGFNEFVVALGYKGDYIKRYFRDYCALHGNMTVRMRDGEVQTHDRDAEDWNIHLMDTGLDVMTGGRVRRLAPLLKDGTFLLTYGDGVADIDLGGVDAAIVALDQISGLGQILRCRQRNLNAVDLLTDVDGDDVGALFRQPHRVRTALPARRTGDESDLAFNTPSHGYLNSSLVERISRKNCRHRLPTADGRCR